MGTTHTQPRENHGVYQDGKAVEKNKAVEAAKVSLDREHCCYFHQEGLQGEHVLGKTKGRKRVSLTDTGIERGGTWREKTGRCV